MNWAYTRVQIARKAPALLYLSGVHLRVVEHDSARARDLWDAGYPHIVGVFDARATKKDVWDSLREVMP